jgi:hypothetical protein
VFESVREWENDEWPNPEFPNREFPKFDRLRFGLFGLKESVDLDKLAHED